MNDLSFRTYNALDGQGDQAYESFDLRVADTKNSLQKIARQLAARHVGNLGMQKAADAIFKCFF